MSHEPHRHYHATFLRNARIVATAGLRDVSGCPVAVLLPIMLASYKVGTSIEDFSSAFGLGVQPGDSLPQGQRLGFGEDEALDTPGCPQGQHHVWLERSPSR